MKSLPCLNLPWLPTVLKPNFFTWYMRPCHPSNVPSTTTPMYVQATLGSSMAFECTRPVSVLGPVPMLFLLLGQSIHGPLLAFTRQTPLCLP